MSKQHYMVNTPIKGVDVEAGQHLALDPADNNTQALLACLAISRVGGDAEQTEDTAHRPADAAALEQTIMEVMQTLLADDPDKQRDDCWRKDGMPEVKALEQRLSFDISAKERNSAWRALNEQARV